MPADVGSLRFGELGRVCEVFVAINASSFRCADVSRRILQVIELCLLDPARNDLGALAFAAIVTRFVLAGAQPALDVNLTALGEILPAHFGHLVIRDN
jgi:hypothetical protein